MGKKSLKYLYEEKKPVNKSCSIFDSEQLSIKVSYHYLASKDLFRPLLKGRKGQRRTVLLDPAAIGSAGNNTIIC